MTLEEAIKHCKEKACSNTQCALEHRQLAEWLQELQEYRKNTRKEDQTMGDYIFAIKIGKREFGMCRDFCWWFNNGYTKQFMWWYVFNASKK